MRPCVQKAYGRCFVFLYLGRIRLKNLNYNLNKEIYNMQTSSSVNSSEKINYSTLKDFDLVERFKHNDKRAADLLLKKYAGLLVNSSVKTFKQYASQSLEFDDAQQDMYLCFFEALNDIDLEKVYDKNGFNIFCHFNQRMLRYNDMKIRKIKNYQEFQKERLEDYYLKEVQKASAMMIDYNLLIIDIKNALTELELPIFELHMEGKNTDEIKEALGLTSRAGVYYHMRNIKKKVKELVIE
jgi:hypothetical protein